MVFLICKVVTSNKSFPHSFFQLFSLETDIDLNLALVVNVIREILSSALTTACYKDSLLMYREVTSTNYQFHSVDVETQNQQTDSPFVFANLP